MKPVARFQARSDSRKFTNANPAERASAIGFQRKLA